jgi:succinate dehydrogenase/fumarate reductase flavoprotein subunit
LVKRDGLRPAQIRRQVQEMAHRNLSPIRTQKELSAFLSFLDKTIQDDLPHLATVSKWRVYNKEWVDAIELENMLHLLKCATISALHRTESRGVHFREDFPFTDNDNWLKENIIKYEKDRLEVYRRPVTTTSMTLPKGKVPYLDMLKKMMESRSDIGGHH